MSDKKENLLVLCINCNYTRTNLLELIGMLTYMTDLCECGLPCSNHNDAALGNTECSEPFCNCKYSIPELGLYFKYPKSWSI